MALLAGYIQYTGLPNLEIYISTTLIDEDEPYMYDRAINGLNSEEWIKAMIEEVGSLIKNQMQELINLTSLKPPYKPLAGKWVFKVKKGKDGEVLRYKARWVVKGYLQQYGVDYDQTFTTVVKPMAFRALFAIAAYYNLKIEQIDIKTAFLYGPIN